MKGLALLLLPELGYSWRVPIVALSMTETLKIMPLSWQ